MRDLLKLKYKQSRNKRLAIRRKVTQAVLFLAKVSIAALIFKLIGAL